VCSRSIFKEKNMGMRKKNNQREALRRKLAKIRRDKNKLKKAAKAKTAGQKLHDKMHGKSVEKKATK
jgi:hypothetical protein